jgi:translation elongation factor EF-Tu-like GTPase
MAQRDNLVRSDYKISVFKKRIGIRTEEGGRQMPIFSGYCPALYFGERQTNGAITPTAALA